MKFIVLSLVAAASTLWLLPTLADATQITSASSNACINVPWHGTPVQGTPVHVKQCDPWRNQQWSINQGQVTGVGGFCLDVEGGKPVDGSRVVYEPCNQSPSQNWRIAQGQFVGIGGKCLDIKGGVPDDGAFLIVSTCSSVSSQQWTVH